MNRLVMVSHMGNSYERSDISFFPNLHI